MSGPLPNISWTYRIRRYSVRIGACMWTNGSLTLEWWGIGSSSFVEWFEIRCYDRRRNETTSQLDSECCRIVDCFASCWRLLRRQLHLGVDCGAGCWFRQCDPGIPAEDHHVSA